MKKFLTLFLAFLMLATCVACGGGGTDDPDPNNLPELDRTEKVKLTIWSAIEPWAPNSTYDKNIPFQEIAKKLNLELEFIHPTIGSEVEQFNFMMTDKKLPDIIFSGNYYMGGPSAGVRDGVYKDLTPYIQKYAPDYYSRATTNSEVAREVMTDDKKFAAVYGFAEYEEWAYSGPIFNKKALDAVGEEVPVTLGDWERVLRKFKTQLGMTAPFALHPLGLQFSEQALVSAFNASSGFRQIPETKEVKYGPLDNGYMDYLNLIRKWYDEGLIARDFDSSGGVWATWVSNFKAQKTGVFFDNPANAATLLGTYGEDWIDAPYPVLNKGDKLNMRLKNWYAQSNNGAVNATAVITRDCKSIMRALDFLNYGYTDEGVMLFNYGTKDKTYKINEQTKLPEFTDYFFSSPNGLSVYDLLYLEKNHNGVFVRQEKTANPTIQKFAQGKEIMERWTNGADTSALIPPITYTRKEQRIIDQYFGDIHQYVVEQQMAFIKGVKNDISKTNVAPYNSTFKTTIENMGINDILNVVETAYARYRERSTL